jgi:hypothetical protein
MRAFNASFCFFTASLSLSAMRFSLNCWMFEIKLPRRVIYQSASSFATTTIGFGQIAARASVKQIGVLRREIRLLGHGREMIDGIGSAESPPCFASLAVDAAKAEFVPKLISGLNGTASALAVYASSGGLPTPGRNTRFWPLAKLFQAGFAPAGFHRKVSAMLNTSRPPLPSFSWRNPRPLFSIRSLLP